MTLAERLNHIIKEQNITKRDFAKRLGVSENYIYILTKNLNKQQNISPSLAKLIALKFGYDENWVLNGDG